MVQLSFTSRMRQFHIAYEASPLATSRGALQGCDPADPNCVRNPFKMQKNQWTGGYVPSVFNPRGRFRCLAPRKEDRELVRSRRRVSQCAGTCFRSGFPGADHMYLLIYIFLVNLNVGVDCGWLWVAFHLDFLQVSNLGIVYKCFYVVAPHCIAGASASWRRTVAV